MGGRALAVEMLAGGPKDAVENDDAAPRSVVMVEHGCGTAVESFLENGDNRLWLKASE